MSIYGTAGQATYSVSYPTLDAMLNDLKDNTSNAIHAQQIRNTVLTLWYLNSGTISSAANNVTYTSASVSTVNIGGLPIGQSFVSTNLKDIFDKMFFPYVAPSIQYFGINYNNIGTFSNIFYAENGSPTASFYIDYNINPGSIALVNMPPNPVQISGLPTITHNGTPGIWYTGTLATQSGLIGTGNQNTTLTLSINDGVNTLTKTASIIYQNKFYWGATTSIPVSFNSATILALNGAGVGIGNILTSTKIRNLDGINGNGGYLIFAMPTSFGTPSFVTNGMVNTAFSYKSMNFTNTYGYAASYSVWYSNTVQNSPISLFQIN